MSGCDQYTVTSHSKKRLRTAGLTALFPLPTPSHWHNCYKNMRDVRMSDVDNQPSLFDAQCAYYSATESIFHAPCVMRLLVLALAMAWVLWLWLWLPSLPQSLPQFNGMGVDKVSCGISKSLAGNKLISVSCHLGIRIVQMTERMKNTDEELLF